MLSRTFVVTKAKAAAIRAIFEQRGELSAAIERRLVAAAPDEADAETAAVTRVATRLISLSACAGSRRSGPDRFVTRWVSDGLSNARRVAGPDAVWAARFMAGRWCGEEVAAPVAPPLDHGSNISGTVCPGCRASARADRRSHWQLDPDQ